MSLPVVNLTSDSEDGDEDVYNSFIVSSNTIPASLNVKETASKNTCSCKCNQSVAKVDPLFRIIFKDEQTARKYRLRIEDILKYVLTSKINDENSESSVTDLVLEVYDPAAVAAVNTQSPRVPKRVHIEPPSNSQSKYQQATSHHVHSPLNVIDKKIKQEKIIENEKKRKKSETQVPEPPPSQNHNSVNLVDNSTPHIQKKIKVERKTENESDIQRKPAPKVPEPEDTSSNNGSSSALTIIYQKIFKQEYQPENRNLETCFENNSVQIGSYGYFHQDKSIFISKDGLTFFVPTFKKGKRLVILSIELDDITKVFTHFSETKPSLFFYVNRKAADGIRELLSMNDPNGPYIDAGSINPIHQRIAISPTKIDNESKETIKQLFKNTQIIEINEIHADSLLAPTTPLDLHSSTKPVSHQKSASDSHFVNDLINESKSYNQSESSLPNTNQFVVNNNKNFRSVFFCRVLKVGSLEYSKRRVFSMDIDGIKFCVPHLNNVSSIVTVNIKIEKIVKLKVSFSEACPVIFLHVSAEAAERIRTAIGMKDQNGPYLDPDSPDETCNKIIILPQQLSENCKIVQELSRTGLIEKLNEEVANNILLQSFSKTKEQTAAAPESNDTSNKNLRVSFQSNSLKIGTYKCVQLSINVLISNKGLNIQVPKVSSAVFQSITIPFNEMTKVYYCIKKVFALFFCTTVASAERIRKILEMPENKNGNVYFNPNSADIAESRIVIIFNPLKFHHIQILKNLLNHTLSEEVTSKVARKMILNKL